MYWVDVICQIEIKINDSFKKKVVQSKGQAKVLSFGQKQNEKQKKMGKKNAVNLEIVPNCCSLREKKTQMDGENAIVISICNLISG